MSNLIKCPEPITGITKKWKVFLAGPIQGAPDWQSKLPEIENVVYLSPRRESYPVPNFNYNEQAELETQALRSANIVLFWIPEESEVVAGRSYAQTTRFELGENMARGKRIILGVNNSFHGRRYFDYKAEKYGVIGGKMFSTLDECIAALKSYIGEAESHPNTFFTSDTHFNSLRALTLSTRPFRNVEEMDWTMIERWNNVVNPCDTVYHLGDFDEEWALQFLSGKVFFIEGNYEREGKTRVNPLLVSGYSKGAIIPPAFTDKNGNNYTFLLCHEPEQCRVDICRMNRSRKDKIFGLFGHIHGRQRIKSFGIDVGVDCNNYTPMSLEQVLFYRNAVDKGFYDNNVWIQ